MNIKLSDHFSYKKLAVFCMPPVFMMIFTSIYGVVDGFFISNFVGKLPFAAVNLVMPFLMILGGVGFMIGTGGSALTAKYLGEGEKDRANRCFTMMILLTVISGVVLSALGMIFIRPIVSLLGADGEMADYCVTYGRVIMAFNTAFMLQNVFQTFFTTAEKPHLGLFFTLAAGFTNMALDALFIAVFNWGVAGAALATGISQCVGGILPVFYFCRPNGSLLKFRKTFIEGKTVLKACFNGSSELMSNISGKPVETVLSIGIEPAGIHVGTNVKLGPHETRTVEFRPEEYPELRMQDPELWWPSGYGEPFLYDCKVSATCRGSLSDEKSFRFGVREFSYKTDGNGVFNVYVNGERIFLKGGNWGMSEYLLRCRNEEYDLKVRLHKEMNFNIIRNWMGSVTDEEFYDACDRYGILVWDDFWLNSKIGLPEFPEDFNANAIEKIKRLRNHPCIAVWCGENEGTPGTYPSGESLDKNLAGFVREYDGSDRHYQSDSRKGNGLSGSGLWKNFPPEFYFARADNSTGGDKYPPGRGWGLRTEIGTAVFTTFESFKKFMPQEHWWPRNEMWNKHFFGPLAKNGGYDVYTRTIETKYGACDGIEEFCEKAQLVNLETTKAMFEAWSSKMWNDAAGIMVWMSQPAYPSFVWQTYDYYYDLTGAFWGAKKGCEPLHILWDSAADQVMAVNSTSAGCEGMTAIAMIFDRNGRQISELRNQKAIDIPAGSAVKCFDVLNDSTGCSHLTDVNFMRLSLKDRSGKTVSSNDYWFGKDRSDCTGLETLPESELAFHISRREVSSGRYFLDLKITNKGDTPAFALKCTLYDKNAGERILPAFQSADYITLMPGEIKIITFETADNPYYDNTSVFVKVKQYGHDEILVE